MGLGDPADPLLSPRRSPAPWMAPRLAAPSVAQRVQSGLARVVLLIAPVAMLRSQPKRIGPPVAPHPGLAGQAGIPMQAVCRPRCANRAMSPHVPWGHPAPVLPRNGSTNSPSVSGAAGTGGAAPGPLPCHLPPGGHCLLPITSSWDPPPGHLLGCLTPGAPLPDMAGAPEPWARPRIGIPHLYLFAKGNYL